MAICKECREKRAQMLDAILEGRLADAARHAIEGAGQWVGVVEKSPGPVEVSSEPAKRTKRRRK